MALQEVQTRNPLVGTDTAGWSTSSKMDAGRPVDWVEPFKLGLSVRRIQTLVEFVYGRAVSIGHIQRLTYRVGKQAEAALARLSQCRQAVARFLMFDETFPKMARRAYSLGITICEHGLIRSVHCVTRKARDIPAQLRETVGKHFRPVYFSTDLDVMYNCFMRAAGLDLIHFREEYLQD